MPIEVESPEQLGYDTITNNLSESSVADRRLRDTYVGPGHWFELDDRHFRLGYGWPTHDELRAGFTGLLAAATQ